MKQPDIRIVTQSDKDYLWDQLCDLPYFRALLRAVEARFYEGLPVVGPVLDLGCGDGLFAMRTFKEKLDVGLDPYLAPTYGEIYRDGYKSLTIAAGDRMPYDDAAFQTVISNSVLEHIPDIQPVINEAARVLRPGGHLLFCSPSENFEASLGGGRLFGAAYIRFFQRISRHHNCDSADTWNKRLAPAGLKIVKHWHYFPRAAMRAFELGHALGVPNLLSKKLFNKWVLWPSKSNPFLRLLHASLKPLYDRPLAADGAYIFIVAQRA